MCPRDDLDRKVTESPEETNRKLNAKLEKLVKEVEKNKEETNQKLDAF